eukprot:TRINITY_DN424_c0_g1_i10.p1 TRINITY_DN424_c0_g1~~TRINITY_DN424_c0_g1_i10.p1  ORF type:complete len:623 (-),score=54.38 TRINITY_DN424_c0_g1_i10:312-2180(-)
MLRLALNSIYRDFESMPLSQCFRQGRFLITLIIFKFLVSASHSQKVKYYNQAKQEMAQGISIASNSAGINAFKSVFAKSIDGEDDGQTAAVPWHLDRLDQAKLPLDGSYLYPSTGKGVNVYIVSSGIFKQHKEFEGDNERVFGAYSFDGSDPLDDCLGLGTHIAGLVGGANYGVAKQANLHSIKVFNCNGTTPLSSVLNSLDWLVDNHEKPAVAIWLTFGVDDSSAENRQKLEAVKKLHDSGVTVVVGAGNGNTDACTVSPAKSNFAITVSGTDEKDRLQPPFVTEDGVLIFQKANAGPCVDIFAPGARVMGPWAGSIDASLELSGTNPAPSIVAGVAALVLENNTDLTPDEVKFKIIDASTKGVVKKLPKGTPNRLVSVMNLNNPKVVAPLAQSIFADLQNKMQTSSPITSQVLGVQAPEDSPTKELAQELTIKNTTDNVNTVKDGVTSVFVPSTTTPNVASPAVDITNKDGSKPTSGNIIGRIYPINMEYMHNGAFTYWTTNMVVLQLSADSPTVNTKDIIVAPSTAKVDAISNLAEKDSYRFYLLRVISPDNYFGPVDIGLFDMQTNDFVAIATFQVRQVDFLDFIVNLNRSYIKLYSTLGKFYCENLGPHNLMRIKCK